MWQTRTICTYVAATVPVDGDNPLLESAQHIGDPPDESTDDTKTAGTERPEPNPGTFEAFMSSFGSPRKWAGR